MSTAVVLLRVSKNFPLPSAVILFPLRSVKDPEPDPEFTGE